MKINNLTQKHLRTFYSVLLGVLCIGIFYYCFNPKIFLGGDNAYYYILGKALAEGKEYVTLSHPGMPLASHYPPGYPAIIALGMLLISKSITAIKVINGAFLAGSVLISFILFEKLSSNIHVAFVGSLLIILNPGILEYSSIMMSEIPFLFFLLLTLLLFLKTDEETTPYRQPYFYFFMLSLAILYHIKTIGIAIVGGFGIYFLFYKNWKWLTGMLAGFIVTALPWAIRDQMLEGNSYLSQLFMVDPYRPELGQAGITDFIVRFGINVQQYITKEVPDGLFPFLHNGAHEPNFLGWIAGLSICLLIASGVYKLKNYSLLIAGFLVSYFGILLLWPNVWTDTRFIIPIIPLLVFCFLWEFYKIVQLLFKKLNGVRFWHPLYLLTFAIFFIPGLKKVNTNAHLPYPLNWDTYISMAKWTKQNTDPNAVVSCRKPALFYLFSERKSFRFKNTPDQKELLKDLKQNNTAYVVLDQLGFYSTKHYLFPALKRHADQFDVVLKSNRIESYLLKFQPDSAKYEK